MLLTAQNISKSFGGLKALQDISFVIEPGQIFGLIGPNGAGKTTLFNCLTGTYKNDSGRFIFDNADITGYSEVNIAQAGISRTFQNIRLFKEMTVLENVMVGRYRLGRAGLWGALSRSRKTRDEEKEILQNARRRLEIARALAAEPKLLCLDEPAAGMNPSEVSDLMGLIRKVCATGVTVLLIEHHMKVVMGICHRVLVLDGGMKIAEGLPPEVRCDQRVVEAYLGRQG
jgi:branched-chain amino acid transport system ATP-binding protein